MKNLNNNFGITYSSIAKESFFRDLEAPVNKERVAKAKETLGKARKVKVSYIGF